MRKIAVFTEGQTERILVRESLLRWFDPAKISFESLELLAHRYRNVPYRYPSGGNEHADFFFLLVDAHGDEGVITAIKERESDLVENGNYDVILGLRDMYCDAYERLAKGALNKGVSNRIVQTHRAVIDKMAYRDRVKVHYAVMEAEAWILAMPSLFQKVDPILTPTYIQSRLGIDLGTVDPETAFYRPSEELRQILSLAGQEYKKKEAEIESICSRIESRDLEEIVIRHRCNSFREFRSSVLGGNPPYPESAT